MARSGLQEDRDLEDGWSSRRNHGASDLNAPSNRHFDKPVWTSPLLPGVARAAPVSRVEMTIAEFVEKVFVPEHVAMKNLSGRTHYHAILKHVLTPEGVERVFEAGAENWKTRLRVIPDWPYLDAVRLCDARPEDVHRLISAALASGYSTQTVTHIRNVVKAIFDHAKKGRWFTGENPADPVKPPAIIRKEAHALTPVQAKEVLAKMQYPEREMTLIAVLTGMNMAEISGLQWKHVNLAGDRSKADGEPIPPRTIAVRKQWYRGAFGYVNRQSRSRNLPIPDSLLPVLLRLSLRADFTGPDDFVLVSRTGAPVDAKEIATRRLRPIGRDLQMPWLSWQVFYRTRKSLLYELGIQFQSDSSLFVSEKPCVAAEDSLPVNARADLVERVNRAALRWVRHARQCAAGGHIGGLFRGNRSPRDAATSRLH